MGSQQRTSVELTQEINNALYNLKDKIREDIYR
jgi:hypothetical protein